MLSSSREDLPMLTLGVREHGGVAGLCRRAGEGPFWRDRSQKQIDPCQATELAASSREFVFEIVSVLRQVCASAARFSITSKMEGNERSDECSRSVRVTRRRFSTPPIRADRKPLGNAQAAIKRSYTGAHCEGSFCQRRAAYRRGSMFARRGRCAREGSGGTRLVPRAHCLPCAAPTNRDA